jgi:restriction system protein
MIGLKARPQSPGIEQLPPEPPQDLERSARDEIIKFIGSKFVGHKLPVLVEAIVKAQGYFTYRSSEGPDGGVDILAGTGSLGFDGPKLCVQVKSSASQVDVSVIRELQGVMKNFGGEQGLLVSWGGFNSKALQESRKQFFSIRLLDQDQLLDEIMKHYDKFDDELKAELPLKRIWTLVRED